MKSARQEPPHAHRHCSDPHELMTCPAHRYVSPPCHSSAQHSTNNCTNITASYCSAKSCITKSEKQQEQAHYSTTYKYNLQLDVTSDTFVDRVNIIASSAQCHKPHHPSMTPYSIAWHWHAYTLLLMAPVAARHDIGKTWHTCCCASSCTYVV